MSPAMTQAVAPARRRGALASTVKTKQAQLEYDSSFHKNEEEEEPLSEHNHDPGSDSDHLSRPKKRAKSGNSSAFSSFLLTSAIETRILACKPPQRKHDLDYHRPLLLHSSKGFASRESLLTWYDGVSSNRSMPWRKAWIDPSKIDDKVKLRDALKRRAYEVWISEIMLQQTRVSTVINYWANWINKWPTIEDLARAQQEEVLSAWRGLGYYSRATRIHTAAKQVVENSKMQGLLPENAEDLQKHVPGVGRYTGGAIASIVFGNAAPMVDGNVLRVLSRQLGVYGDVKSSKKIIDLLWDIADALVKQIADDAVAAGISADGKSERPGLWGQALMELGSTICTPLPSCRSCPISSSCKVYAEGKLLADVPYISKGELEPKIGDLEDLCTLCQPFEEDDATLEENVKAPKASNGFKKVVSKCGTVTQSKLSAFAFTGARIDEKSCSKQINGINSDLMNVIESHAKKFPLKVSKKAIREEEAVICVIQNGKGEYLLHHRPDKGLLAGMWELPTKTLPDSNDSTKQERKKEAKAYVELLVDHIEDIKHVGEIDSIRWVFSHLKLTMHVHLFKINSDKVIEGRWANSSQVEAESMGTGMRKCWTLIKNM